MCIYVCWSGMGWVSVLVAITQTIEEMPLVKLRKPWAACFCLEIHHYSVSGGGVRVCCSDGWVGRNGGGCGGAGMVVWVVDLPIMKKAAFSTLERPHEATE